MAGTLPFSVAERLLHREIFNGTGEFADLSVSERRALMQSSFLPRPKRNMDSSQYTLDGKLDIPYQGFGGQHHFVVGGQSIKGELEDGVFGLENGNSSTGNVQKHTMYSLFAEDNWTPIDALTVTAGVRHDHHNMFGGHVSPRLYGVYTMSPTWTLKGGVSTGYKTPKTTDLYDGIVGFGGQGTSPWAGNPDLEPETSVNSEIALYWNSADDAHNFNVTWFHNDFDDKIDSGEATRSCVATAGVRPCVNLGDYGALGYSTYQQKINVGKARIQGVELAGRYRIVEPLSLNLNYTWTDSEQLSGEDAGLPLTYMVKHMANAALDWTISEHVSLQLIGEARSRRYRGKDVHDDPLYYKGYQVLHLGAQWRINEAITLGARVNNLLDKDFTSFQTDFALDQTSGLYTASYTDDYNNKDKSRNLWLSLNMQF